MELAIKIAQFILSLSILVVLHEWGHYITAKMFGMRVEKFYLFFNPYFSLLKKKIGETEWGLGWIPLGGYVKISGMIDESMDKEQLKKDPEPWEFRSKPAWQRLIVMLGGIIVNAILAVLIFGGIFFFYGEEFVLSKDLKYGISTDSLGEAVGFKSGDKILAIDDQDSLTFPRGVLGAMIFGDSMTVERGGNIETFAIPKKMKKAMIKSKGQLLRIQIPAVVGGVIDTLSAAQSGIKKGDEITAINGQPINYFHEMAEMLQENKSKTIDLTYKRGDSTRQVNVKIGPSGYLGVEPVISDSILSKDYVRFQKRTYNPIEAIARGYKETKNILVMQVKQFSVMFDKDLELYKEVGSLVSIATMFAPQWDWPSFWNITGILSIVLAFFNLLPIPGLDGGHAVFAIYEMVTGRKPGDRFMEIVQTIGMIFLLGLMFLVLGWDIYKNMFN